MKTLSEMVGFFCLYKYNTKKSNNQIFSGGDRKSNCIWWYKDKTKNFKNQIFSGGDVKSNCGQGKIYGWSQLNFQTLPVVVVVENYVDNFIW